MDQCLTHELEIRDGHGRVMLEVTCPAKVQKSRFIVEPATEHPWVSLFSRTYWSSSTTTNTEVAPDDQDLEGFGKALITTADNYVLKISAFTSGPAAVTGGGLGVDRGSSDPPGQPLGALTTR
jgi:hypothetical protein